VATSIENNNHPIYRNLSQLKSDVRDRLQRDEEPTNRDILWSLSAVADLMLAQFEFSQHTQRALHTTQQTCAANHAKQPPKPFWVNVWDKVADIAAYTIAGLAVLAMYWLLLQVIGSGIHLPTP